MIRGIHKAVGPVQPSEVNARHSEPYRCDIGLALAKAEQPELCLFLLRDGGPGRTFFECRTHNFSFMAIDGSEEAHDGRRGSSEARSTD